MRYSLAYCILLLLILNACSNDSGIRYIELNRVLDQFKLKKELEGRLVKIQEGRTSALDSLELQLKILSRQIKEVKPVDKIAVTEFEVRREEYLSKKQRYSAEFDSLSSVYDKQITEHINQYMKEFGEAGKFKIIFGADGSGSLMFADSTLNITNEFIVFVDKKYSGK